MHNNFNKSKVIMKFELTTKIVLAIIGLTAAGAFMIPTYAANTISSPDIVDDSIQSSDIKNETIQTGDIKNSEIKTADLGFASITSVKIKDGQVMGIDLANDTITTEKIKNGTIQEQDIAPGVISNKTAGQLVVTQRDSAVVTVPVNQPASINAACQTGEKVVGGGYDTSGTGQIEIKDNNPEGNGWHVTIINEHTVGITAAAHALCAKIVP